MANYCDVESLLQDETSRRKGAININGSSRRVKGAVVRDKITGDTFRVGAKSVLLCGGPFTDAIRRQADPQCAEAVTGSGGGTEHVIFCCI